MERLAGRTIERFGRIDTWINDAGVAVYAPLTDLTPDEVERVVQVNLL